MFQQLRRPPTALAGCRPGGPRRRLALRPDPGRPGAKEGGGSVGRKLAKCLEVSASGVLRPGFGELTPRKQGLDQRMGQRMTDLS